MHPSTLARLLKTTVLYGHLVIAAPATSSVRDNDVFARALGINCRGSGLCGGGYLDGIVESVRKINTDKTYINGEHIVCSTDPGENFNGEILGGECAFLQYTKEGIKGSRIQELLEHLKAHKCPDCGSVPINFPESNDPKDGILTVNYVSDRRDCITADGVCPDSRPPPPEPAPGDLEWAVIGDSWSAGVAYNARTAYDVDDQSGCMRTNEAWGAQMADDDSWVEGKQKFNFLACSGARTWNMSKQISQSGKPSLVVTTIGGNNALFGKTVLDCVFKPIPETPLTGSYSPQFENDPKGEGTCKKALKKSSDYIADELATDFRHALDDIFASEQAKKDDFWLVISGYAHFFNVDTDECDKWSFAPWYSTSKPKLVKELRLEFNHGLDRFHRVQQDVIRAYKVPKGKHLGYVPISKKFDGHRFCEAGHSLDDQWMSRDVWLWNLQYFDAKANVEIFGNITERDGVFFMGEPIGTGDGAVEPSPVNIWELGTGLHARSGDDSLDSGWTARPFHQKRPGHAAMKDGIIEKLRELNVPGVKI